MTLTIIKLENKGNVGDNNNVRGITRAVTAEVASSLSVRTVNIDEASPLGILGQEGEEPGPVILIGAGSQCLKPLAEAKDALGNTVHTVWSGHQIFTELDPAIGKLDIIALPGHVTAEPEQKDKDLIDKIGDRLVTTILVPHNLQPEDLLAALDKWGRDKIRNHGDPCLTVVLGGDAPTREGEMRYYTQSEAFDLGYACALLAEDRGWHILATSGHRTGQHDTYGNKIATAHRPFDAEGQPLYYEVDRVSRAFIQGVSEVLPRHRLAA